MEQDWSNQYDPQEITEDGSSIKIESLRIDDMVFDTTLHIKEYLSECREYDLFRHMAASDVAAWLYQESYLKQVSSTSEGVFL